MACDTMAQFAGQTLTQRKEEVRKAIRTIDVLIAQRKVQVTVGPQGAITFTGIPQADRAGITDACVYRLISRTGSAATRLAIARAEQLAGRAVDRRVVSAGVHSHDGGRTWSKH